MKACFGGRKYRRQKKTQWSGGNTCCQQKEGVVNKEDSLCPGSSEQYSHNGDNMLIARVSVYPSDLSPDAVLYPVGRIH
jgi:hypothetical protein